MRSSRLSTRSLGPDVKVCPCQTIVPLYRNHVFAQIKPTTLTRIDFGLALKGARGVGAPAPGQGSGGSSSARSGSLGKLPKRLIDTGGLAKKDRITHRFAIESAADIDGEVRKWLKIAYELDGK